MKRQRPERVRPERRNDRQHPPSGGPRLQGAEERAGPGHWVWGLHAVSAALANAKRRVRRLVLAEAALDAHAGLRRLLSDRKVQAETVQPSAFETLLGPGAVHQGIALLTDAPEPVELSDAIANAPSPRRVVVLDQVSDPHNVGAILRSAAAFGACALIMQDRHSPPLTGTLMKAASGATEFVPIVRVVNVSRTLDEMAEEGFLRVGLAEEGSTPLAMIDRTRDLALVLGAEGPGLRRLTREHCDVLAALPTRAQMPSLNVSNAAAVALFALSP